MGVRVTYPNEGLYEGGKPRWEVFDDKKPTEITFCRFATDDEARTFALIDAMSGMQYSMEVLGQQLRDLATYGITAKVSK